MLALSFGFNHSGPLFWVQPCWPSLWGSTVLAFSFGFNHAGPLFGVQPCWPSLWGSTMLALSFRFNHAGPLFRVQPCWPSLFGSTMLALSVGFNNAGPLCGNDQQNKNWLVTRGARPLHTCQLRFVNPVCSLTCKYVIVQSLWLFTPNKVVYI